MRSNWEVKKLGEVLKKTETINPTLNEETEFIYIDVSSVSNKTFVIENINIIKGKDAPSRARKLIKKGDIVFATVRPTLCRISIIPDAYDNQVCSTGYFVLRAKEYISNRFIFYYLLTETFKNNMFKLQKGASYPAVTDAEVREQIIQYPVSLPEQQRIVAILDEAFDAIARAKENAQKNLQNAKDFFESYLQSVFVNRGEGWEEKKLGELTTKIGSGATPSGGNSSYKQSGISLVRSMNVYDEGFIMKNLAYIDGQQAKKLDIVTLMENDVLLNITGASISRCCVVPKEILPARVNQHVTILRPKAELISCSFLHYSLISKFNKDRLLKISRAGGATREALTKAFLISFEISIPPIIQQNSIVSKLNTLSTETKRLEAIYSQKLADLEEKKKTILQKAFNGELTAE